MQNSDLKKAEPSNTFTVLMVCMGNICRSPIAQGVFERVCQERNLNVLVDSAGTGAWHAGEKPDKRAIEAAAQRGINIHNQRARQFIISDFDRFDIIFTMDQSNDAEIRSLARDSSDLNKIKLLMEYASHPEIKNIPDPYYGTSNDFNLVLDLIEYASHSIITKWKESYPAT